MEGYWPEAKRKLELGRRATTHMDFRQAEYYLAQARTAIADNEGVDCARWGFATLDLATCALRQKGHAPLAARQGKNAMRVLLAAESPALRLAAAEAAIVVGDALGIMSRHDEAVLYYEFASKTASAGKNAVSVASHADVRLAFAYTSVGNATAAADAVLRAWATVGDENSWVHPLSASTARWIIRCLERDGRFVDAMPVWERLASNGFVDSDWLVLHKFVGAMAAVDLGDDAKYLFYRVEETVERAAQKAAE